ncbi:hypothetical protein KHQ89_03095 [Mycoplasmatota bacterium]|nr:hypothetical protein KHQ89_03095 [Mycoplasmatota bacterium]
MSFLLSLLTIISSYQVIWENIEIDVNINEDIMSYVDMPKAKLYIDGILHSVEATYTYDGVNRTFLSTINTSYAKTYKLDYEVYFALYDIKDQISIYFNVIDNVKPVFLYVPTYEIDVGDKLPDLESLIVYEDNYDEHEDLTLEVNDIAVDTSRVGEYPIVYYLYDKSLNKTEKTTYIRVVDKISPTVSLKKPLIIEYGIDHIEINTYFEIEDNVDDEIKVYINDKSVSYHILGSYQIWVTATDQSNQESTYQYTLDIIDTVEPTITLASPSSLSVHDIESLEHLERYILNIYDNYDDLLIEDVEIKHDIDIGVIGKYTIYFSVYDQSNNHSQEQMTIQVVDNKSPSIQLLKPLVIEVFSQEPFLITYFEITDNYYLYSELDIDIDVKLDLDVVDQYQIILIVEDPSKNIAYYYDYVNVVDLTPVEIVQSNDIIITNFEAINYTSYFSFSDNYDEQVTDFTFDDYAVDYTKKGEYSLLVEVYDSSKNLTYLSTEIYIVDIIAPILEITEQQLILPIGEQVLDLTSYIIDASDNYDLLNIDDVEINGTIDFLNIGIYTISYCLRDSSLNETCINLDIIIDDLEQPIVDMSTLSIKQNEPIDYLEDIIVDDVSNYDIYYDDSYIDTSILGIQYLTYVIQDERGNFTTYVRKIEILPQNTTDKLYAYIPLFIVLLSSVGSMIFVYKKYSEI